MKVTHLVMMKIKKKVFHKKNGIILLKYICTNVYMNFNHYN